jgi:prepilin-type N-terminal cleavage/methylation domain-containing protein
MNSHRCAMSLIEVTLVILVMGILAAVAAPRFADSVRAIRLEAAARQLAAHIDYVRGVALNEGRTATLVFDNVRHTYASESVDFPQRTGELLQVSMPLDYDPTFTLEADFDSQSTLSFDFEGVPHAGASPLKVGRIVLGSGGETFAVVVSPGTGATRVQRVLDNGVSVPVDGYSGASL